MKPSASGNCIGRSGGWVFLGPCLSLSAVCLKSRISASVAHELEAIFAARLVVPKSLAMISKIL